MIQRHGYEDGLMIEAQGLHMSFADNKVLDDVSLQVQPGETVAIVGCSGCGKSTLLRCLIGALKPDRGIVRLFGEDITAISPAALDQVRKRFGVVFQQGALYSSMTAGQNIALLLEEHTDLHPNIIRIMVELRLDMVGLKGNEDMMPAELSGGMQRRVALARALALEPEIIFFDEPTSGLDPVMAASVTDLICDLSAKLGVTSVVVTHDIPLARRMADKIAMMYHGKLRFVGTPREFTASDDAVVGQFVEGMAEGPMTARG